MIRVFIKKIGVLKRKVSLFLMTFFSSSFFLSAFYYGLFNKSFQRECNAVLCGKLLHIKELQNKHANKYLLVRNTHRIEKGLLMKPRRKLFALSYIDETVDSYISEFNISDDREQLKWSEDVLKKFFAESGKDPIIDKAFNKFAAIANCERKYSECQSSKTPYIRKSSIQHDISFDQFYRLCKSRRSVRWFLDKPVEKELIDSAIMAAIQSPSACNRQPFEFRIFNDKNMLEKVVNLPGGTKGYSHSIQAMIVTVGNLDAYYDEKDRHLIYIDTSLANMSLMFALETLGLGSCPINWPDIEEREKKMADLLNLSKAQRPIMCIGVGYPDPDGMIAYSEKRSINLIRKYH